MAFKNGIDTSTWEPVEWFDKSPGPGCYMGERKPHLVHGITVQANNSLHARFIWALTVCDNDELDCACCGAHIRYVTVFKDANGKHYPVGEECAEFI